MRLKRARESGSEGVEDDEDEVADISRICDAMSYDLVVVVVVGGGVTIWIKVPYESRGGAAASS